MGLSVVTMVHGRNGIRMYNFIHSLLAQNVLPDEIIVVDTTPGAVPMESYSVPLRFLIRPMEIFNKSRALNIGIKAAQSDTIMVTDIDFIFSPGVTEVVTNHLSPKTFVLCEAGYLPKSAVTYPLDWPKLISMVGTVERRKSPGTIQAAHRDFWHAVRGYDERFEGGLGGMDDDMWIRARKHGLELVWIPFGEVYCLHQWHPISDLKGKCSHLFVPDPEIVKNPQGWGA